MGCTRVKLTGDFGNAIEVIRIGECFPFRVFARNSSHTASTELLKPAANDYLQVWPVSRRVNSSRASSDDPTLIDRVAA